MSGFPEGRFYEKEFPDLEEIVVAQVKNIVDMGAYVSLLEYNGREGMMLLSELSKRRIRSVSKLLRVGRTEICMVLRSDEEKGYIDLSKRRVAPEDAAAKEESFAKAKAVHSIMRHVAVENKIDVEDLCMKVSWPLYKSHQHAYEAFRKHVNEEIDVWSEVDFSKPGTDLSHLEDKLKAEIDLNVRRRLVQQMLRLRAKVRVECAEYEGIDAVKAALKAGLEVTKKSEEEEEAKEGEDKALAEPCEVKIKLLAHPHFALTCMCKDKELGMRTMDATIERIKESIEKSKGKFEVVQGPQMVGHDEKEKEEQEEESEDGSDSSSEEDETMGNIDFGEMDEATKKRLAEEDEKEGKSGKKDDDDDEEKAAK